MRERVHQLNGTFEFDSEPGRGIPVRATDLFGQLLKSTAELLAALFERFHAHYNHPK
jgi:hypothetical protein